MNVESINTMVENKIIRYDQIIHYTVYCIRQLEQNQYKTYNLTIDVVQLFDGCILFRFMEDGYFCRLLP